MAEQKYLITNKELAESEQFQRLCIDKGVTCTKRQASKYRNGKGILRRLMK